MRLLDHSVPPKHQACSCPELLRSSTLRISIDDTAVESSILFMLHLEALLRPFITNYVKLNPRLWF